MNKAKTNIIIEAENLLARINNNPDLLIVDLCSEKTWQQLHLPNAVHIRYADIVRSKPPVNGLLPDIEQFSRVLSRIGWHPEKNMVCYDDEGGGMAGRFIWTCHAYGIDNVQMLNGGINYWYKQQYPINNNSATITPVNVEIHYLGDNLCEADYIINKLGKLKIMDARSKEEYLGTKKYAARAGRIPGAVNFDWQKIMDTANQLKTHDFNELDQQIRSLWQERLNKDDEIIVYCQTHHRSALNYTLLKHLGYSNVKGYHGSWSDWGNRSDTPIETG